MRFVSVTITNESVVFSFVSDWISFTISVWVSTIDLHGTWDLRMYPVTGLIRTPSTIKSHNKRVAQMISLAYGIPLVLPRVDCTVYSLVHCTVQETPHSIPIVAHRISRCCSHTLAMPRTRSRIVWSTSWTWTELLVSAELARAMATKCSKVHGFLHGVQIFARRACHDALDGALKTKLSFSHAVYYTVRCPS